MDAFGIIFVACVSVLFGMILMIFLQYCILLKYFKQNNVSSEHKRTITEAYCLPEALKKHLDSENYNNEESKHCSVPISLMLQFLFHELRHSDSIKRWLYRKLSLEFDELLTKTTTGKFFDAVTIRDMNLGSQFPDIKNLTVENVILDKNHGHIDVLNLCVQLDYSGSFLLSVDAKMKFGKTAYLSITVKRISGLARLQFTRLPYTHWSFSFYSDPLIELGVESQFQGRQLQSNITSLIINQIKKAIKRKHTLPNYKIRYKPFFNKTDPSQLDNDDCEMSTQGKLDLTCIEITRLAVSPDIANHIYCTFTIDSIAWVRLSQHQNTVNIIIDLTIMKNRQQQLGVVFKQELLDSRISSTATIVTVETVMPHGPAADAGLCPGDILLAVDLKTVSTMTQVAKIIKSQTGSFSLRIRRTVQNYHFIPSTEDSIKSDAPAVISVQKSDSADDLDEFTDFEKIEKTIIIDNSKKSKSIASLESKFKNSKLLSSSNENVSKLAQTIGNFTLRKRKTSVERVESPTPSPAPPAVVSSTKSYSTPNTPQKFTPTALFLKSRTITEDVVTPDGSDAVKSEQIPCYETPVQELDPMMVFNTRHSFELKETDRYLNINVWGRNKLNEDILLGYTNIPLMHILSECCNSMLGNYVNTYSFLPPENIIPNCQTHPLFSHSGFEHCFCYGDILLSFVWTNGNEDSSVKRKLLTTNELCLKDELLKEPFQKHDFIRTQFHRTTHCDFCSKKIWLKDAVQCRNCALCCHKKCVFKCQTTTTCTILNVVKSDSQEFAQQPEITMTEIDDHEIGESDVEQYLENGCNGNGMKRVNSANSLAIPGTVAFANSQSRSLPPSPQHTPGRKQSIVNMNPFTLCPSLLETCYIKPTDTITSDSIDQIIDQLLQCNQNDNLMDMAKETGIQFYATIPHEQRTDKINILMTELKKTLDNMTLDHMELSKQMNMEENPTEKARLAFLVGQADAKVHALSVLMLHYCSGLQQVQEKIV